MKYRIPVVKKIIVIAAVMLLGTLLPAFGATFNWTGAVSTDWDTPGNWDSGSVPGSGDGVNIPSGTPHAPALSSDVAIAGLVITPTASLTLNNYNLTVTSDTLLAGSITGTNSNITLGTVGASTLYLSGNITTVSGNIDINHVNITAAPAATPQIVTGIGNIDLHGLVDSTDLTPRNLTVAAGGAGGTLTLNQDVGSLRALGTVNFHASAIHLGAGLSSLSATDFTFSGAIELTADTSFNFSGTSLVFNCPIDSDTAGPWDLTVTAGGAGILTLDQDVGGVRALGTVNFHAPVIHLGAGLSSLSATDFTFSGAIELTADTSFNFSGTSLVFNCTIDSNTAGPWNLTVAAGGAGTLTLNQNVGGTHVLGTVNLSANPPGTPGIFLGAPILAVDISIAGNIALTADCGLEADPVAGTIGIGNISGNFNFVMAAGGQITFNGTTGNIDLTGANNTVLILDSDQNISSSSHIIKVHSLYLTHQSSPPTPPPATSLNNISNDVEVIASDRSGAFVFRNSDALEIGSVSPPFGGPVINGITTSNSDIFVGTRSGILTVNQPVSSGTGAGNISLQARNTTVPVTTYTNLNINSVVDAGNGNITLRGTPVNLGFGLRGHDIDLGIIDIVLTNHITLNAVGTITFGGTLKSDPSGPWDLFINAGGASVALNGDVGNPGVPPAFKPVKNLNVAAASVNLAAGISFNLSENLTIQGGCTFNANNSSMNIGGSVTGAGILNGQTSSITIGRHLSIGTFNCVTSSVKFNSGLFATTNSYTFYNLEVDKPAGMLRITGNVTVGNNLQVTNGIFATSMHNLTVNGNTVISSSGSIQDSSVANGGTLTFGDAGTDTLTLRSLIATQNGTIVVNAATTVNVSSFLSTGAGSGSIQIGSVSGDSLFVMDSGNLSLNGDINLTNPCILIINSSGDINGSAHSIAADTLLLEGSGSTILNNSANNIGVIASSRNGSFELRNSSSMQIASRAVNSTIAGVNINRSVNGITTNGQDIAVETINGNLTVAAPVSSGPAAGGDILLIANNSAGPIVYSDLNITDFVNAGTGNMLLMGDPVNLGANLKGAHLNVTRSIVLTAHAYLEFSGNLLDFTCTIDSNNDPAGPWNFILAADAATTHVDFRDNIGVRAGYSRVNDLIINAHTVSLQAPLSAISLAGNLFISAAGSFFNNTARAVTLDVEGSVSGAGTLIAGNSSINIGGELSITTFNCGTSTVTFDTGTDVSLNSYIFHNMVINKPGGSITSTGSIVVSNSLTMSAGTWNASPFPSTFMHIITGGWDSRGITFNAGGSAIRLLGTDPIFFTSGLGEPFYNLITENNRTLGSNVAVSQNLLIQAGTLSVNNHTLDVEGSVAGGGGGPGVPPGALHGGNGHIYIGGNLQLDSARFHCGTSTITFDTDQNSIIPRTVYHNIVVAKDGPGTGTNNNVITLMGPWSAANLSISQGRLYANGDLTVTGTVRLKSSTPAGLPVLDMLNHNFNFAGYDASPGAGGVHEGELRLTGEQAQQTMPVLGASFERYGLITYYAGSSNGAIRMAHFWNLTVDAAGRLIYLNNPVTVYGSSNPYGNGTLATPVTGAGLNGLRISNGIFICAAPANTITLYGSFIVSGLATYVHSDSSLVFMGNAPSYIAGNNLYHKFIADDASVAGKIFYIQNGRSFTLPDDPSAEVRIHGTNLHPPGGSLMPPPLSFPSPRSYVYLVSAAPGSPPLYWLFNKQAAAVVDLQYVYLLHSDASAHPQVVPPDVETEYCPGWIRTVFVEQSWTQDVNSNGRIDRIVVEAGPALNMNFTSFTAEVDGYTVLNYDHPAAMPSNQFAIELEEGAYLDTGVTPAWRIVSNNSLRDTTINGLLSLYNGILPSIPVAKSEEIPYDEAPPLIGYTLAAADKNEIFVHFSEPVIQTGGLTEIAAGNFNTAAGGGIASLRRVSPSPAPGNQGMRELLLITNTDISAADIAGGAVSLAVNSGAIEDFASPSSTHVFDATDPPDTGNALFSLNHRISDVGLGIAGNGIVEPVFARASGTPAAGGSGPGMVTRFDGSEFLEEEDFVLQAHRYSGLGFNPQLVYANAIPSMYRNGALWLPSFTETSGSGNFSGLVPRPFSGTLSGAGSLNGNLIDYTLNASDPMVMYGKNFEFFFYNAAADLYMGRLEDDTASNWYRGVRPWIIPINEVALQAGGVTIMNNVINPSQNELVSLSYVVKSDGMATVQVFDLSGDLVEVLQRGYQEAGKYFVSWNGRNRSGRIVARGIYFIRFVGPGGIDQVRKVLVIK